MWSPSLSVRAAQTMRPPSAPSRSAIVWPMPRLAPVTSTLLPSSRPTGVLLTDVLRMPREEVRYGGVEALGILKVDGVSAVRELAVLGAGDRLMQLAHGSSGGVSGSSLPTISSVGTP